LGEPRCSTAEDIPSSQPDKKLARLLDALEDPAIRSRQDDLREEMIKRAKLIVECWGHR
jgi:hypothetical protein